VSGLSARLLDWYAGAARDLPWRRTRDPYAIWVSEVMLQQTRVETVIPYYLRFLERFPTPSALAAASLDDVLSLWAGLGYYRRARTLWHAAREVTDRYGGRVPDDEEAMRSLSGVGPYTTGAVLSIAYGRPLPVVDGNVIRVLGRIFALEGDLRSGAGARAVWARAASLVVSDRPGDFNQALMELGSLVCTPAAPRCPDCPVKTECQAWARGETERYPEPAVQRPTKVVRGHALVSRRGDRVLLGRRRDEGLFGGLWEPPTVLEGTRPGARRALSELGLDLSGLRLRHVGDVRHVLTHRVLSIAVLEAPGALALPRRAGGGAGSEPTTYLRFCYAPVDGSKLGLSTLARRVLAEGGRS
jgi:A/G-specific adenine glycosylase